VPVSSNRCSGFASFSVSSSLGPSPDIELTATKSRRFTMAMSTLHIHPFDPMEDESVFEEEPKPCDCLRCCKEPYCNGGYGLSHDDEDTFGGTEDATSAASATDAAFADKVPDATNHKIFDHNAAAASDYGKAESTSDTGPDLGSKEKDIWPQLMILGCGELEAKDREY